MVLFPSLQRQSRVRAGASAVAKGDFVRARRLYTEALEGSDPAERVRLLNEIGLLSTRLGDAPAAVDAFRGALAQSPDQALIHVNLAIALVAMGDRIAARDALDRALAVRRSPEVLFNVAALVGPDDPGRAFEALSECLASPEAMTSAGMPAEETLYNLVSIGLRPEWFDEVRALIESLDAGALGLGPWDPSMFVGVLLSKTGRHEEALDRFTRLFETWPDPPYDVRYERGMALLRSGRVDEASLEFGGIRHPVSNIGLARSHLAAGNPSAAGLAYVHFLETRHELAPRAALGAPDMMSFWETEARAFLARHPEAGGPM